MNFKPFDPDQKVAIRQGAKLPHWTQHQATYAVTFRLIDSLPQHILDQYRIERADIIRTAKQLNRLPSRDEEKRLSQLFSERVESYLNAGHGDCWLKQHKLGKIVKDALLHFSEKRYFLHAWCVMPNHVHAVVQPISSHTLSSILHSWKSFTAKECNRSLGRTGPFWQTESFDHLIRGKDDLANQVRYVLENPAKAGLKNWRHVGGELLSLDEP